MKKSFTLIELLVVVAIIAVLAAILMPALGKATGRGAIVSCLNNQKQLVAGAVIHAQDHQYKLPQSPDYSDIDSWSADGTDCWANSLLDYVKDKRIFRCDSAEEAEGATGDLISYSSPWRIQTAKYNTFDDPSAKVLYLCYQASSFCKSVPRERPGSMWTNVKTESSVLVHGDGKTLVGFLDGHAEQKLVDELNDADNFRP